MMSSSAREFIRGLRQSGHSLMLMTDGTDQESARVEAKRQKDDVLTSFDGSTKRILRLESG